MYLSVLDIPLQVGHRVGLDALVCGFDGGSMR